jgi:hypothetical protein
MPIRRKTENSLSAEAFLEDGDHCFFIANKSKIVDRVGFSSSPTY